MATLLLGMVAACAGHEARVAEEIESLRGLALAFPGAAALIEGAAEVAPRWTGDGYRVSVRPDGPRRVGKWSTTARGIDLEVLRDDARGFVLSVPGVPGRVGVRRVAAEGGGGSELAELGATERAVRVRHGGDGIDAFLFATDASIEELVLAREGVAEIRYEFELPRGWSLRRAKGRRPIVEVLNGRGSPELRMVADRVWDAAGQEIAPVLRVGGNTVRIELPPHLQPPLLVDPEWQEAGTLSRPHLMGTATLLTNGKVLITGCQQDIAEVPTVAAEIYDPITGHFELTGSMHEPRFAHTATLLRNGKVLVAGGIGSGLEPSKVVEIYDPAKGSFELIESMALARYHHTATRLPNGQILMVGGGTATGIPGVPSAWAGEAELFDPVEETFRTVGALATPRHDHAAVLLPDGRVMVVGGGGESPPGEYPPVALTSVEIYEPNAEQFHEAEGGLIGKRRGAAALLLGDQESVLVAGGFEVLGSSGEALGSLESYNLVAGQSSVISPTLDPPRGFLSATLLPDGQVLLAGGSDSPDSSVAEVLGIAQRFDPASSALAPAESMPAAIWPPIATVLPSGNVLFVGGTTSAAIYDTSDPEIEPSGALEMTAPRNLFTAMLLHTGKVLLYGLGTADLFDPRTRQFRRIASGLQFREAHTATRLRDGRVLITGGRAGPDVGLGDSLRTAEVFDPDEGDDGEFREIQDTMASVRANHTATLLRDGRVVLVGGNITPWNATSADPPPEQTDTVEIFDPHDGGQFTSIGPLHKARCCHKATILPDGTVLVTGGGLTTGGESYSALSHVEIFEPNTESFVEHDQALYQPRASHRATVLHDGRVLVSGGGDTGALELYYPEQKIFVNVPAPGEPSRNAFTATLLPSGKVLLAGGRQWPSPNHRSTALFDPVTLEVTPSGDMDAPRLFHAATLLPDGSVLLAGGRVEATVTSNLATANIWRERRSLVDSWRPSLEPPLTDAVPGVDQVLRGHQFTGVSEASGGSRPSATNHPIALWMPLEGPGVFGGLTDWSADRATWSPPSSPYAGPGFLFVIANGIPSESVSMSLPLGPAGAPCSSALACQVQHCVDGVCCDGPCDGTCEACTRDQTGLEQDGTCGFVIAGSDPDDECEVGTACFEGECRASYCDGHVVHSVAGLEDCTPFRCTADPAQCIRSCSSNADCIADHYCAADESCQPLRLDQAPGCQPACTVRRTKPSREAWLLAVLLTSFCAVRRRYRGRRP